MFHNAARHALHQARHAQRQNAVLQTTHGKPLPADRLIPKIVPGKHGVNGSQILQRERQYAQIVSIFFENAESPLRAFARKIQLHPVNCYVLPQPLPLCGGEMPCGFHDLARGLHNRFVFSRRNGPIECLGGLPQSCSPVSDCLDQALRSGRELARALPAQRIHGRQQAGGDAVGGDRRQPSAALLLLAPIVTVNGPNQPFPAGQRATPRDLGQGEQLGLNRPARHGFERLCQRSGRDAKRMIGGQRGHFAKRGQIVRTLADKFLDTRPLFGLQCGIAQTRHDLLEAALQHLNLLVDTAQSGKGPRHALVHNCQQSLGFHRHTQFQKIFNTCPIGIGQQRLRFLAFAAFMDILGHLQGGLRVPLANLLVDLFALVLGQGCSCSPCFRAFDFGGSLFQMIL